MKNCFKAINLVIKEYPILIILYIVKLIENTIVTLLPIYIIDSIVSNYPDINYVKIIIMFTIMFVFSIIANIITLYMDYIYINVVSRISVMLYKKLQEIDYDYHENPQFLNDFSRALEMGAYHIYDTTIYFFDIIINVISTIGVLIAIYRMTPFAILYVFIIGIVYFILRIFMSKISDKYQTKRQPLMRKAMYSNRSFTLKESIPDIKTTNIGDILLENNNASYKHLIKVHKKYMSLHTVISLIGEILICLMYPALVLILCYTTINNLDIAAFSSLTVAATTLSMRIGNICSILGMIQTSTIEIKVPFELLKMKGEIEGSNKSTFNETFKTLDVNNLSFSYQKNYKALNNISIHLEKGNHIAIVGENGSGKTTLVKLLLHLYDPVEGNIKINGRDYKDISVFSLRKIVGAVFQNIEIYSLTIAENILLHKINNDADIKLVNESLKFADLYDYVYSLKENINTIVTREFDKAGVVFSGGQIQKLAIARGYAQNYQLFIMDEPSSALDPLAEAKLYDKMLALGKDKTLIFISHRLTATVNASYIYLFEKGSIIEEGTHQELMQKEGKYKQMFVSQSHKYLGETYE